jgi:hypothetical protein
VGVWGEWAAVDGLGGPAVEWKWWAGEGVGEVAGGRAVLVGFTESPPAGSRRRDLFAESSAKPTLIKIIIIIANKSENVPTLNMTLDMVCIAYKKVVVVKLKFKFL